MKISTAESCTGGLLGSKITDISGSSQVYEGGVIAYTNPQKIIQLGVKQNTLERFTDVSREVALEMAYGVRERFNTDIGVSTTGFLDLEEGHPLVYCAIASEFGNDCFLLNSDYLVKIPQRDILKDRVCKVLIDRAYRHALNMY